MNGLIIISTLILCYISVGITISVMNRRFVKKMQLKETIEIRDIVWFENLPWEVVNFDLYTKDPVLYRAGYLERCPKIEEVMLIKKGK